MARQYKVRARLPEGALQDVYLRYVVPAALLRYQNRNSEQAFGAEVIKQNMLAFQQQATAQERRQYFEQKFWPRLRARPEEFRERLTELAERAGGLEGVCDRAQIICDFLAETVLAEDDDFTEKILELI